MNIKWITFFCFIMTVMTCNVRSVLLYSLKSAVRRFTRRGKVAVVGNDDHSNMLPRHMVDLKKKAHRMAASNRLTQARLTYSALPNCFETQSFHLVSRGMTLLL